MNYKTFKNREERKWRGTVCQRNNSRRLSVRERLRGSSHTQHVEWKQSHTGHIREKFQNTAGKKKALQLGRKQRPTQDPVLVLQVKVKGEKDLHNFYLFICLFLNWSTVALQNFVFCQTSTWISHRHTYVLLKVTS